MGTPQEYLMARCHDIGHSVLLSIYRAALPVYYRLLQICHCVDNAYRAFDSLATLSVFWLTDWLI